MTIEFVVPLNHREIEQPFTLKMDRIIKNPVRTNHVNAYGEWELYGQQCDFEPTKMLRFKFMHVVTNLEGRQPRYYPFFMFAKRHENICYGFILDGYYGKTMA
jgi:hypothetical protein